MAFFFLMTQCLNLKDGPDSITDIFDDQAAWAAWAAWAPLVQQTDQADDQNNYQQHENNLDNHHNAQNNDIRIFNAQQQIGYDPPRTSEATWKSWSGPLSSP